MKNIFFVVFFLCQLGVQAAPILPVNLRCEYRLNPLGIDIRIPRLSWNFQSAERNKLQSAYEIIVSDKLADIRLNKGTMWASGKVTSSKKHTRRLLRNYIEIFNEVLLESKSV